MVEWLAWLTDGLQMLGEVFSSGNDQEADKDGNYYMAGVPIKDLPDSSRVWVFGSDRTLDAAQSITLMAPVDAFLQQWKAHGAELTAGRDWKYGRFLTIAVDQSKAGA